MNTPPQHSNGFSKSVKYAALVVAVILVGILLTLAFGGHNAAPSDYSPPQVCSQAGMGQC